MAKTNALEKNYKWRVLLVVMIGTMMAALDTSIVNVSIPAIMADFGASLDDIEWVVTGYMLAFAALMPLTAWFRERVGHRLLYVGSLIVFTVGSVLCGLAWDTPSLVFARVLQAIGGGALTPTGMAMISEVFEPHERGRAMGYWGIGVILGPAFGPTLGGYLTKVFGWPSIFLINLPIGVLGAWFALKVLAADKPHADSHRPFDGWGFAFLTVFLISFLFGISKGEHEGWTSPLIVWCGILSFFSFVLFLLIESLTPHRIIDIELFKYPVFTVSMILTATRSMALFGGVFLLPVFLQQIKGLDEIESGLILLPGSLIIGFFMPLAGRMSEKVGPRYLAVVGLIALAIFMYLYKDINADTSNWAIIFPTLVRGFGISFLMAPLMATMMNAVPKHKAGMASSMMNIVQQVGGSLGIAVLATVLSNRVHHHLGVAGTLMSSGSPTFLTGLKNLTERAHEVGYSLRQSAVIAKTVLAKAGATRAAEHAFQDSFLVGSLIVAATILPAFLLPSDPPKHKSEEPLIME
ncbi:MAG: DHA2 family efflux MFS transporter permease subunit [Bdellovibrionales bacterium]